MFYITIIKKIIIFILPIVFFLALTYLISYKLIGGIVSIGDFPYYWPTSNYQGTSTWNMAYLGMNRSSAMFGSHVFFLVPLVLTKLGFSNITASYIHNFGLIFVCSYTYYLVSLKLSKQHFLSLFIGSSIILNNFVLEHLLVLPGIIFYSLISYAVCVYLLHKIYVDGLTYRYVYILIFLSFTHFHPFFFVIHFLLLLLFFTLYYIKKSIEILKFIILILILVIGTILINSYWLLPFIFNLTNVLSTEVYGKDNLYAVFFGYFNSVTYANLFNLYHYPGQLGQKMNDSYIQYFYNYYMLGLIFSLSIKLKSKLNGFVFFIFFIFLFFFNLALGPKSIFTGRIWMHLFENYSFFGFFRSFSRFIILYLVLIHFLIIFLYSKWNFKFKKYVLLFTFISLFASNTNFLTGNMNGYISMTKVPNEYIDINNRYFFLNQESFNIYTLPNLPYENYIWNFSDKNNSKGESVKQSTYFREFFFAKPVIYNRFAVNLEQKNHTLTKLFAYDKNYAFFEGYDHNIDTLNIRYILIQKDTLDILNNNLRIDSKKYTNYFKHNDHYKLLESNNYFDLYENKYYWPIIVADHTSFFKITDTKYLITEFGNQHNGHLDFTQNSNSFWRLYFIPQYESRNCDIIKFYNRFDIRECKSTANWIDFSDLLLFFNNKYQKPIRNTFSNTNTWKYNFQNLSPKQTSLLIYFEPQKYYVLGYLISVSTFTILTIAFLCTFHKLIKRENTKI